MFWTRRDSVGLSLPASVP
jgi:hypothetical protein